MLIIFDAVPLLFTMTAPIPPPVRVTSPGFQRCEAASTHLSYMLLCPPQAPPSCIQAAHAFVTLSSVSPRCLKLCQSSPYTVYFSPSLKLPQALFKSVSRFVAIWSVQEPSVSLCKNHAARVLPSHDGSGRCLQPDIT
jgi:hypothetical protein